MYAHVLILLGDYDYDCECVMTNHALQCSLVSGSTACCCETHVEIVIETWTVGASAEYYDYVSESKSVALCDVLCNTKFQVLFVRSLIVTDNTKYRVIQKSSYTGKIVSLFTKVLYMGTITLTAHMDASLTLTVKVL